jgi:dTDP-glucose 4,6-dehydratase
MILITGGAGFIGINFVKYLQDKEDIFVVDKMTYSSNNDIYDIPNLKFCVADIKDTLIVEELFQKYRFSQVINFAAESHVDNSIDNCRPFVDSNILGTINLLELSIKYGVKKFIQISTDEVFGEVPYPGKFNEYSNLCPRNPYSASKAAAEHFVSAFSNTYGLKSIIINCSNNYGPYQHKEKLIPQTITNLRNGKTVPVYGDGSQIRDWIYVKDTCRAIYEISKNGNLGERYCVGGDCEVKNLDLVKAIIKEMRLSDDRIEFVKDRPGHDFRYSTDFSKIKNELGWSPEWNLEKGLKETIRWYDENRI